METTTGSLGQGGLVRRVVPFAAAAFLVLSLAPIAPGPLDVVKLGIGFALTVAISTMVIVTPWSRLPGCLQAVPPLLFLVVIGLARDAVQGAPSGFAPLILLPLLWLALYGTRRELAIILVGIAVTLIAPIIVVGGPRYPSDLWLDTAVWIIIASFTGVATHQLVRRARTSADRLQRVIDTSLDAYIGMNESCAITDWSPHAERLFGWRAEEAIGRRLGDFVALADDDSGMSTNGRAREFAGRRIDVTARRQDGTTFPAEVQISNTPAGIDQVTVFVHDISARKLREEEFRTAFEAAPIGMALIGLDGDFLRVNDAMCQILGFDRPVLETMSIVDTTYPEDLADTHGLFRRMVEGETRSIRTEKRCRGAHDRELWVAFQSTLVRDPNGSPSHILAQVQDITERRSLETQLRELADRDPLTGLLNRRSFARELDRQVSDVRRHGPDGALLVIDLDGFKHVNDHHGHGVGDRLIVAVSSAVQSRLRDSDAIARIGGDEFAVLLPRTTPGKAVTVAESILDAVRAIEVDQARGKSISCSIGIAGFAGRDMSPEQVMRDADLAMYEAKHGGRNRIAIYGADTRARSQARSGHVWVERIERALDGEGFILDAQPIVHLPSREVLFHELLVRLQDETGAAVPPAEFLGVAERLEMIQAIDRWVVGRAVQLLAEDSHDLGAVSVNLSGKTLSDGDLLPVVRRALADHGVAPERLVFEITETSAVTDILAARDLATELRALGCKIAIDDFGAGFGSFYYLKHVPFDYIKIDGEFVHECLTSSSDEVVIRAIVGLAKRLGKQTIAEFTTDEETAAFLCSQGVDHAQGFHLGRPARVVDAVGVGAA